GTISSSQGGSGGTNTVAVTVPPGVVPPSSSDTLSLAVAPAGGGGSSNPPPSGTLLGTSAFTVPRPNRAGQGLHDRAQPMTLTVSYSDADLALAGGDATRLHLYRYDETARSWVDLGGIADLSARTISAQTNHLSLFGLAARLAPPTAVN